MTNATRLRCFVAVRVEDRFLDALEILCHSLANKMGPGAVRWVRREQRHLTLEFLGQVPEGRLDDLVHALDAAIAVHGPISLTLGAIGAFPSNRDARVLWVGVGGDEKALRDLQRAVDLATAGFGDHQEESRFTPHLTLGRKSRSFRGKLILPIEPVNWRSGESAGWVVDRVCLVRSMPGPEGPAYTDLAQFALGGGAANP